MAQAAISPSSIHRTRIRSPSPSHAYTSASASPPPGTRTRQSARLVKSGSSRRQSSSAKENEPVVNSGPALAAQAHELGPNSMETFISPPSKHKTRANGRAPSEEKEVLNGGARVWRDSSIESDDAAAAAGPSSSTIRARRTQPGPGTGGSGILLKRQSSQQSYNGLPTLPTIGDDDDTGAFLSSAPSSPGRAPPPAPSAHAASDPKYGQLAGSGVRRRRASSIKRKLSPGVTPTKVVDWEIPRKVFHSSIGE